MCIRIRLASFLVSIALFSACSSPSQVPESSTHEASGHETSERDDSPASNLETIVILGTNDIHGTITPIPMKSREAPGVTPLVYEFGGATVIAAYVKKLRAEYQNQLLWLDGGDQFQGSIESNLEFGKPMVEFFNAAGLNATAVGNHEFDFGLAPLKARMSEADYPYLAANIRDRNTGKIAPFPGSATSRIFKVGKLKVGVIGLTTLETPFSSRASNVKTLIFEDLKDTTLRESQVLRNQGAQIILITAHVGAKCDSGGPGLPSLTTYRIRKPTDPQGTCNSQDDIVRLLKALPQGTVDAVVAGHTHTVINHWIAGVPVIQGASFGRYINLIHLTYDWNKKKVRLDRTRIEGPIPVCTKIFENQQDCDGSKPAPAGGRGPLVEAKFHGQIIQADPEMVTLMAPILKKSELEKNRPIGIAARPLEHRRLEESELGDIIADAMRRAAKTDVAYMNPGGVRAPIEVGTITFGEAFRTLPFDNTVAILRLTGSELKTLIQVIENGHKGFGSVSGLRLKLLDPGYDAPFVDLDGTGRQDHWKMNRLLDIHLSDGSPVLPNKIYTLATTDFLVTGGDDFGWPMSQIPEERKNLVTGVIARDALVSFIQANSPLNTLKNPIIDPVHPRMRFEKPRGKGRTKRRKLRHHPHSRTISSG